MTRPLQKVLLTGIFALVFLGLAAMTHAQGVGETTLRVGTTYIIDTINPAASFFGYNIKSLLYETLVEAADGNNVYPGLAESWSVSEDGLVWTFKLREGALFSDGTPATAVEAAWSINWIIENEVPTMISYLTSVTGAEAVDATTLNITVSEPVSNMISSKLLYVYIMPPHVWEGKSPDEIAQFDDPAVTIGAGPYRMTDYQPDEYMILEANENYFRGAPPVDKVIYQQYATDDALVQALITGEVDLATTVPASSIQTLEGAENIQVLRGSGLTFLQLSINSAPDGTAPASLKDPVVRLAMDHAIDRDQIAIIGYLGYASPAAALLPPGMGAFQNTDLPLVDFNIEEANRLLDTAGYLDSDGDGVREDADGNPLEYRLAAPDYDAALVRILEIIADGFSQIGLSAPPYIQSAESLAALQIDYDYDMILWDWNIDADPHFLVGVFTCAETQDGGWNDTGYCNPDYDALFNAQATSIDVEQRRQVLWEMQQVIYDARPWIMTVYPEALGAYRSDRFSFSPNLTIALLKWALLNEFSIVQ